MTVPVDLDTAWALRHDVGRLMGYLMPDGDPPESPGNKEQFATLMIAWAIYLERNEKYGDLWQTYGATDTMLQTRHKLARAQQVVARCVPIDRDGAGRGRSATVPTPAELDDLWDAVNYMVFTIRNLLAGNPGGME